MSTHERVRQTFLQCWVDLCDRTANIDDLSRRLLSAGLIDPNTWERIRNSSTSSEKMDVILSIMITKDYAEYEVFLTKLKETSNDHCHDRLITAFEGIQINASVLNQSSNTVASTSRSTASNAQPSRTPPVPIPSRVIQDQAVLKISGVNFTGIGEAVQRNLVQLEIENPPGIVSSDLIATSLNSTNKLRKISFTGVKFTGEFAHRILFPKLESVNFTNCKLPKDCSWNKFIFFAKTQQQVTGVVESICNMGFDISIINTNNGIRFLDVKRESGTVEVDARSEINLLAVLDGIDPNRNLLKKLTCTGFQPFEFDFGKFKNLKELSLLNVEILVMNDMRDLRKILASTKSLTTLQCSIGENRILGALPKSVVVYLTTIQSSPTLEELKLENFNLKHTDGKITGNGAAFPLVTKCDFRKCKIDGPIRNRFSTDFPKVEKNRKIILNCVDETDNEIQADSFK